MASRKWNPAALMPPPGDRYSQVVTVDAGVLAFVAGQVATDSRGELVGLDDYAAQARQIYSNLKAAIEAVGGSPADIVKMTVYVVRYTPNLVEIIFNEGRAIFNEAWPHASSTLVGVEALGRKEWLIEIDAVASLERPPI